MIKNINVVAIAILVTLLTACTSYEYFAGSKPLTERIDDAKILLTAVVSQIGVQTKNGIMDPDEAQGKLDELANSRDKINELSRLLNLGLDSESSIENRLYFINAGTLKIQKYISNKARGIEN